MSTRQAWTRLQQELLPRVALLEKAALAAVEGHLGADQLGEARREAHRLAGSLGVLNLPAASRHSAELEQLLQPGVDPQRLSQLVWEIVRAVERGPDLVDPDLPELTVVYLGPQSQDVLPTTPGLRWVAVRDEDELRGLLLDTTPGVVVADSDFPSDDGFEVATCRHLRQLQPDLPILALFSPEQSLPERVRAIQAGADQFVERDVSPAELTREVVSLVEARQSRRPDILVVEDDAMQGRFIQLLLQKHGFTVTVCEDSRRYEEALLEQPPDLVIADLDMPGLHGLELCRRLRTHPRWRSLPVLICTAHQDPEVVQSIFLAGADDYVSKACLGVELVVRVRNRLVRTQAAQSAAPVDPESGLLNLQVAHLMLERQLSLARRQGVPLTLARLDLSPAPLLADPHLLGRLSQDALRSFRREDVLARLGPAAILAGLYGSNAVDAATRLKRLLAGWPKLAGEEDQFATVALVEFPDDGSDHESLLKRLDEVTEEAHMQGLLLHSPNLPQDESMLAETLDVVVVEDDPMLAQIEMHSLRSRGYRCRWIADGDTAARELAGDPPRVRPRLVLLDVDLPGQSGLQVLHAMKACGALRGGRTKVIVVTVRANEAEVLESLETGADDHLVKPFTQSVLMSRVALALRR